MGAISAPKAIFVDAPKLRIIDSHLDARNAKGINCPALMSAGRLNLRSVHDLSLPSLKKVESGISLKDVRSIDLPALESIGSFIDVTTRARKFNAPSLKSIGDVEFCEACQPDQKRDVKTIEDLSKFSAKEMARTNINTNDRTGYTRAWSGAGLVLRETIGRDDEGLGIVPTGAEPRDLETYINDMPSCAFPIRER